MITASGYLETPFRSAALEAKRGKAPSGSMLVNKTVGEVVVLVVDFV